MNTVCLVSGKQGKKVVDAITRILPVDCIVGSVTIGDIVNVPNLEQALARLPKGNRIVCFLSSSRNIEKDVLMALRSGAHVLSRGIPAKSLKDFENLITTAKQEQVVFHCGGVYAHTNANARMIEASADPNFGRPVFLRATVDGGVANLVEIWWALSDALNQALALIRSKPTQLHVTANTHSRVLHGVITISCENRASAQISAIKAGAPEGDFLFLGTGGMLTYAAGNNRTVSFGPNGEQVNHLCTSNGEPEWLRWFVEKIGGNLNLKGRQPLDIASTFNLLRALRKSQRAKETITVPLH